jgi:hypothetical protein
MGIFHYTFLFDLCQQFLIYAGFTITNNAFTPRRFFRAGGLFPHRFYVIITKNRKGDASWNSIAVSVGG